MPIDLAPIDAMRDHVGARLDAIERQYGVEVLFAVESGSRAWGFASPNSDFDCRFVYRHPRDWYVSVSERRDVIETPLDEFDLDLAGWDLRKALRLLVKSNPVLHEWLTSPIVWREAAGVREDMRGLFAAQADLRTASHHYLSTAHNAFGERMRGERVKLKRYFYAIRPLLAVDWIAATGTMPPMSFDALYEAAPLPGDLRRDIDALLAAKRSTDELGEGERLPVLDRWIEHRLADRRADFPARRPDTAALLRERHDRVDACFRRMIGVG